MTEVLERAPTLLAYIAGIVDGEGYIGIKTNGWGKNGRPRYVIRVGVGNSDISLIQLLQVEFGGSVYGGNRHLTRTDGSPYRPFWKWELCSRKAASFIESILPYLRIKKPQAELALKFQSRKVPGHWKRGNTVVEEAERLVMAKWNREGGHNVP